MDQPQPTTEPAPLTIVGLKAENFKRLRAVSIHPAPTGLVEIRGKNGHGKSSVIDLIWAALGGKRAAPQKPIHEGSEDSDISLDLGDLMIRRRWTDPSDPTKSSLVVENPDGARYQSPQALLDKLTGRFVDPVRFAEMTDTERAKEVLGMVDLGIDLEESRGREAAAQDVRRDLGREERALREQVEALRAEAQDAPSERVDVAELLEEMRAAQEHNAQQAQLDRTAERARREAEEATERVTRCDDEIERLEQELTSQRARRAEFANAAQVAANESEEAEQVLMQFEVKSTDDLQKRIEDAGALNEKHSAAQRLAEREQELTSKAQEHEDADATVQEIRAERREALEQVKFPVEGMGYDADAGVLTLNGHPFDNASQAEKLKASAELAMAKSPRIQVIFARNGSLLDADHKAMLAELVEKKKWQFFLEVVDDNEEGGGVWISEGEAFGPLADRVEEEAA